MNRISRIIQSDIWGHVRRSPGNSEVIMDDVEIICWNLKLFCEFSKSFYQPPILFIEVFKISYCYKYKTMQCILS